MTEEFLHHIWKFRLFDQMELSTTTNEQVTIMKSGDHNFNSGPDFFNARIKIGETEWAGNVEVHINASDWNKHHHQTDKAYDNIILHVVYNADVKLYRKSGAEIPAIEIRERFDSKLFENYLHFKTNRDWIPCSKQISAVPALIFQNTIDKLLLERLERKSLVICNCLKLNHNDWEETFYKFLARNFGFKINSEPFELLAKGLPLHILSRSSVFQIEALLFGQAGMLNEHFEEAYPIALQNEYIFLKQKFRLQPIEAHLWKYSRLRPVNFPCIRISQFSQLICNSSSLFSHVLEADNAGKIIQLFNVTVTDYWLEHYQFGRLSEKKPKHLGEESINNIIINTIVPFLFTYGKYKSEQKYIDKALLFLEETKGESNSIIQSWSSLNVPVKNAYQTQALLQLKNDYCSAKRCLQCNIGNYLLKNA